MDPNLFNKLGIEHPEQPVTRGEVVQYIVRVILAERKRIADTMMNLDDREDQAMSIGGSDLDKEDFAWRGR